jgi:hypothetical protein
MLVAGAVAALILGQASTASASVLIRARCNFFSPKAV